MELEEYAESVRRQAHFIMTDLRGGRHENALLRAVELCSAAAQMKTQARLQAEAGKPDRYDLTALPAVSAFDE